jgi:hypothetical protein
MTTDALWAKTWIERAQQPLKVEHSTDETLLAQMVEIWHLQRWIVSPNLQASVKAICSSPEMWDTFRSCSVRQSEVALVDRNVWNFRKSFTDELHAPCTAISNPSAL